MTFTKAFPKRTPGQSYPEWVDISLTDAEEEVVEAKAREENINVMRSCLRDAKGIVDEEGMKSDEANIVRIASHLFEKRASHSIYWKEEKAREKFENHVRS